jgi:hypothetical protein
MRLPRKCFPVYEKGKRRDSSCLTSIRRKTLHQDAQSMFGRLGRDYWRAKPKSLPRLELGLTGVVRERKKEEPSTLMRPLG